MITNCGYLDNIVYDYEHGKITPENEILQMCETLTFAEETKLKKHYNLTKKAGANTPEHFKLVTVTCDIIKNNKAKYIKKSICPTPTHSSNKYINWKC